MDANILDAFTLIGRTILITGVGLAQGSIFDLSYLGVTISLRAGDRTFSYHGMILHAVGLNIIKDWRVAHVIIFVARDVLYNGQAYLVDEPLD